MINSIDFYFDFYSPYGYLASLRIDEIAARHGCRVNWRPFMLGATFSITGHQPLTETPMMAEYTLLDLERSARLQSANFCLPDDFPKAALSCCRAFYLLADDQPEQAVALAKVIYAAIFGEGRDGTDMGGPTSSVRAYGHNPSHIFRGIKADIWEGGHHVPFFARWPGKIIPGSESNEIICHTDLLATCAALLNKPLPDNTGEDSYNILPAMLGEQYDRPIREATVHHSIDGSFAIRQGKWKLELCGGSGGWSKPSNALAKETGIPDIQLYDLSTDPGEENNLHEQYPEIVEELTSLLQKYKDEGRSASY